VITQFYEDITVGDETETRGRTITETDVVKYSMISGTGTRCTRTRPSRRPRGRSAGEWLTACS
jgi:hypothetical protein